MVAQTWQANIEIARQGTKLPLEEIALLMKKTSKSATLFRFFFALHKLIFFMCIIVHEKIKLLCPW
jgi:hypothetical protein